MIRHEVYCENCSQWHPYDPGLMFGGAIIVPCPLMPKGEMFGFSVPGRPAVRVVNVGGQ